SAGQPAEPDAVGRDRERVVQVRAPQSGRGEGHSFEAPSVRPETKYRMVRPTRANIGTMARTNAANTEPPLPVLSPKLPTNPKTPAEIVVFDGSWMTIEGHR